MNEYERMSEADPRKTYEFLMERVESAIRMQDKRRNMLDREQVLRGGSTKNQRNSNNHAVPGDASFQESRGSGKSSDKPKGKGDTPKKGGDKDDQRPKGGDSNTPSKGQGKATSKGSDKGQIKLGTFFHSS